MLCIHSGHITWKAKRKSKKAATRDELEDKEECRVEDALVTFITVEGDDDSGVVEKAVHEIDKIAKQIKTQRIVLFPFAHLFPEKVCNAEQAIEIFNQLESKLAGYETSRVPFGWYKEFEIQSKGHPLAVLSRKISPDYKDFEIRTLSILNKSDKKV